MSSQQRPLSWWKFAMCVLPSDLSWNGFHLDIGQTEIASMGVFFGAEVVHSISSL